MMNHSIAHQYQQQTAVMPRLAWFQQLQQQQLQQFLQQGFPTRHVEAWKYTPLDSWNAIDFHWVAPSDTTTAVPVDLPASTNYRLVFVDGQFQPNLSSQAVVAGMTITPLVDALAQPRVQQALVAERVERTERAERADTASPLVVLNTALMQAGVVIQVSAVLQRPIELCFYSHTVAQATLTNYRHLLFLEPQSQATVIETYYGGQAQQIMNTVTQIFLARDAQLDYYQLPSECQQSCNALLVEQQATSRLNYFDFVLGGPLARQTIQVKQVASGAECQLRGLYCLNQRQQAAIHSRVDHYAPRCQSQQWYKGVADQRAKAVINGKVVVHPQAQRIVSAQYNRNLLLSSQAEVNTKPELEIYADDVKCSHGATVGELDQQAIFYLRSRGLLTQAAKHVLLMAFVNDMLDTVTLVGLRDALQQRFATKLG